MSNQQSFQGFGRDTRHAERALEVAMDGAAKFPKSPFREAREAIIIECETALQEQRKKIVDYYKSRGKEDALNARVEKLNKED